MDRPKQRQIVVAVPSGYCLASLREGVDAALLGQEGPDLMPGLGIGFSILGRLEHSAENGDQGFFHPAVLILERLEFLLAAAWVFLMRRRSISINSSRQFERVC